eukprot:jgi/Undpi1/8475/HiC_scaffold_25.g10942.m1
MASDSEARGDVVNDDDQGGDDDVVVEMSASIGEPLVQAILDAIDTGVPTLVNDVLAKAEGGRVVGALTGMTSRGMPLIAHAARTGNLEMFLTVNRSMAKHLSLEQARKTLTITAEKGRGSLLVAAADGGNAAVFSRVSRLLDGEVICFSVCARRGLPP